MRCFLEKTPPQKLPSAQRKNPLENEAKPAEKMIPLRGAVAMGSFCFCPPPARAGRTELKNKTLLYDLGSHDSDEITPKKAREECVRSEKGDRFPEEGTRVEEQGRGKVSRLNGATRGLKTGWETVIRESAVGEGELAKNLV